MRADPLPQDRIGYLGLGSNLGDRREALRAAARELDALPELEVLAASSLYETEPVGEVVGQPSFLNACLRVRTALGPVALLDRCKEVERKLGREPGGRRHGPRPIDVDVLLLGDERMQDERLTLPHPEVTNRRFVLVPLVELDPDLELPDGRSLAACLRDLGPGQAVERLGTLDWPPAPSRNHPTQAFPGRSSG